MEQCHINGLIAPTFTPFTPDGALNLEVIDQYAHYLIHKGVDGIFVCGTSGEGLLLSVSERKEVLEAWMPYQKDLKIIAHVAATSYIDSVDLAAHAQSVEVNAVACMGPSYLPPESVEELVAFNELVARVANKTAYYYYHIPSVSKVQVKMHKFLKAARYRIPNLKGIKFTSHDMMDMQECILLDGGEYNILHGHDEVLLSGLTAGVRGGVGTSFNIIPQIYRKMMTAFDAGDLEYARELQLRSIEFVKIMLKYENSVVSTKAMLNLAGLDLGPCRLPLRNLRDDEIKMLEEDLKRLNFFDTIVIC